MKKTKGNLERGITLVALIITIIVMLILVAVTVTVLVNSDIIGQAEKAGALYQNAHKEKSVGNVTIDATEYNSLSEYLASKNAGSEDIEGGNTESICIHVNDENGICTKCGGENLINFTILGKLYTAEKDMAFMDWVSSEYCTDNFKLFGAGIGNDNTNNSLVLLDGYNAHYVETDQYAYSWGPIPVYGTTSIVEMYDYVLDYTETWRELSFSIDDDEFSFILPNNLETYEHLSNYWDSSNNTVYGNLPGYKLWSNDDYRTIYIARERNERDCC